MTTSGQISGNPLLAIFAVGAALVSSTNYSEMLNDVVTTIGHAMDVSSCDVQSYVAERDAVIYEAYWCMDGLTQVDIDYIGRVTNLNDRPDLRINLESPTLIEQHVDDPDITPTGLENLLTWGYKSALDVPLRVGDEKVGILGVQERRFTRRFTPSERDLFRWLCELAALGIHNAGVIRRQQERSRHLTALLELGDTLASVVDLRGVFATIARVAAGAFGAPRSTLYEYDPAAETLTARGIFPPEMDGTHYRMGVPRTLEEAAIAPEALGDRPPIVETVSDLDLDEAVRDDLIAHDEKTSVTVPIVYRGETLGVLLVLWTKDERILTPDELVLATGMARQAAMALRRAQLLANGGSTAPHGSPSSTTPLPPPPFSKDTA